MALIQFHSAPIAEPIAHITGFLGGVATFHLLHAVGASQATEFAVAVSVSAVINLVLGAKLNLAMLDILGLLILRPVSAVASAGFMDLILKAMLKS